jgi:type IV pilus assembly protein PilM
MSISIDIGTSEVKLVELTTVNEDAVVSKIHCKSTWNDLKSFNPEKLEKSNWVASINDICVDTKINPKRVKSIIAAISGKNLSVKEITTLEMNEDELYQSLEFEAKKHIPLDGTEAVMDYHIIGKNQSEIDKIDVLLVATTKNIIKQFDSIIRDSGFKNSVFDAEPIALANCLTHNYGKVEEGIDVILDIGTSTSTLVVFGESQIFFTRQIEISGFSVIKEIMGKYETDYLDAKKILDEDGVDALGSSSENDDSNSFSLEVAEKTIFTNLVDEIRKSLRYYVKSNNGNSNFKRLFLSGGFAEIGGLKDLISDGLKIETEILNPFNKIVSDVKIENPSKYTIAVGLALRGLI